MNSGLDLRVIGKLVAGILLAGVLHIERRRRARRTIDTAPLERPPLGDYRRPPDAS